VGVGGVQVLDGFWRPALAERLQFALPVAVNQLPVARAEVARNAGLIGVRLGQVSGFITYGLQLRLHLVSILPSIENIGDNYER
jgi:hypothetical protein